MPIGRTGQVYDDPFYHLVAKVEEQIEGKSYALATFLDIKGCI